MGILRTNEISGLETPTAVTGSVSFDGTGDYLTLASSGDFAFGTGDFTIEAFCYRQSGKFFTMFDHLMGVGNFTIFSYADNVIQVYNNAFLSSGVNPGNNKWFHLAVVRQSGVLSFYIDGIKASTTHSFTFNFTTAGANIGVTQYGEYSTGYISNLRILKGTALYTSNFTPPVHELQPIGDTVLLCCNNPDSAGAEATGKTITVNGNAAASTVSPGLTRDFTYGTQFEGVAKFDTQGYFVPPSGTTEQQFPIVFNSQGRGVFHLGQAAAAVNTLEFITISSLGNSADFGDLTQSKDGVASCSSNTRGLFGGGRVTPAAVNTVDYIIIATTGNAVSFGSLTENRRILSACSNSTRGLFGGGLGTPSNVNTIDYVTIASTGNAQDFGDLTGAKRGAGSCSSTVRALWCGGYQAPSVINSIDFVTIASTGNAVDFGDATVARNERTGLSDGYRGIFAGGYSPAATNVIERVFISTSGIAQDFGDLTFARGGLGATSSKIRGVFAGGYVSPTYINVIEYITIASSSNSIDFGDLLSISNQVCACSNGHGGLS